MIYIKIYRDVGGLGLLTGITRKESRKGGRQILLISEFVQSRVTKDTLTLLLLDVPLPTLKDYFGGLTLVVLEVPDDIRYLI